ncbi:MAG: A/G-specific adenine glycosylase [Rhodobacteraceae bacterium]|nr:A/G-specific adenine glycosylase [Paracoccaceae bacterium]
MSQNLNPKNIQISGKLLRWYDQHARELPWRVSPTARKGGIRPDPYHVWLSEIMLQQTTVVTVGPYFQTFLQRWPTVQMLASAPGAEVMGEWAGLGYYARARNLLKCARVITQEYGGSFPKTETDLLNLPGIGPYTAAAIAAIAYDLPTTVLDGNVERVMARLFEVSDPLPDSKPTLRAHAASQTPTKRPGDYAQAVMDLGATICTPRSPSCTQCPITVSCKSLASGTAANLPKKRPKPVKPTRSGVVYFAYTLEGHVLLETRPDKGLLGGMLALPSTDWTVEQPNAAPPIEAEWQNLPEIVRHVFTHFNLNLTVAVAKLPKNAAPMRGQFTPAPDPKTLPTVMRKAYLMAASTTGLD